jgi:hypothetical protein
MLRWRIVMFRAVAHFPNPVSFSLDRLHPILSLVRSGLSDIVLYVLAQEYATYSGSLLGRDLFSLIATKYLGVWIGPDVPGPWHCILILAI